MKKRSFFAFLIFLLSACKSESSILFKKEYHFDSSINVYFSIFVDDNEGFLDCSSNEYKPNYGLYMFFAGIKNDEKYFLDITFSSFDNNTSKFKITYTKETIDNVYNTTNLDLTFSNCRYEVIYDFEVENND